MINIFINFYLFKNSKYTIICTLYIFDVQLVKILLLKVHTGSLQLRTCVNLCKSLYMYFIQSNIFFFVQVS